MKINDILSHPCPSCPSALPYTHIKPKWIEVEKLENLYGTGRSGQGSSRRFCVEFGHFLFCSREIFFSRFTNLILCWNWKEIWYWFFFFAELNEFTTTICCCCCRFISNLHEFRNNDFHKSWVFCQHYRWLILFAYNWLRETQRDIQSSFRRRSQLFSSSMTTLRCTTCSS